jgi:hypothetical protein
MQNDIGFEAHDARVPDQDLGSKAVNDVLAGLFSARYLLLVLAILGGIVGGIASQALTPKYEASMTLIPAQAGTNSNAEDFISAASPTLAALIGSGSRTGSADFNLFLQSFSSLDTATILQADHHVLQILFRGRWDKIRGEWLPQTGVTFEIKQYIGEKFGRQTSRNPSTEDVADFVKTRVKITANRMSGFQDVTFIDSDPKFAADFLNWLFEAADKVNRARILQRSRSEAAALEGMIANTMALDERQALLRRKVSDELVAKLSETGQPIAANRIEPAWTKPDQVFPSIVLFTLGGAALVLLIGILTIGLVTLRRSTARLN